MTKLAAVSIPYDPRDKQANIDLMTKWVEKAAEQGVELIVFPEEAVLGCGTHSMYEFWAEDKMYYCRESELVPEGESTQTMIALAQKYDMYIAWSMSERDSDRWTITYNTCVLVGPEGFVGKSHKVHLPLCERLFHVPGDSYNVYDTKLGKIGLCVCYDMMYPEAIRALAIQGADIVVCPTGWPNLTESEDDPDHKAYEIFAQARAAENQIFWVQSTTCNGMGIEKVFEGHSQILGPNPGQVFDQIGFEEGMAVADVNIEEEILKARIVSLGGSDMVRDRRPSTYGILTQVNPYANYADGEEYYECGCCCEE